MREGITEQLELRELSEIEFLRLVASVVKRVDPEWLRSQRARIPRELLQKRPLEELRPTLVPEGVHPLAWHLARTWVWTQSFQDKEDWRLPEDLVHLALLAESLQILEAKRAPGVRAKFEEIVRNRKPQYEKTLYELEVAAGFAKIGHDVSFIPTGQGKTADLLVNGCIEVECKRKDAASPADAANIALWSRIEDTLRAVMEETGHFYSVSITTDQDPTEVLASAIVESTAPMISEGLEGRAAPLPGYSLILKKYPFKAGEPVPLPLPSTELDEEPDWTIGMVGEYLESGERHYVNPSFFAFKSRDPQAMKRGVLDSIEAAAKQLSGERPGIIFVHAAELPRRMRVEAFSDLETQIKRLLSNRRRVAAVVLTFEVLKREGRRIHYMHKAHVIHNPATRLPLPAGFEIPVRVAPEPD